MKRRQFLRGTGALGATGAFALLGGCEQSSTEPQSPIAYEPGKPVPWINWAGNQSCQPQHRPAPASIDELVSVLKNAKGTVRAVGAGHSFSAVVPTDDTLIATDLLSGVIDHDPATNTAQVLSGTRLHDLGYLLADIGQALPNMPDMAYLALGGAIVNCAHATGVNFGSMGSYVNSLRLATVDGELLECSASSNPDIFKAALTSAGALGIVTDFTLQNQADFDLTEVNKIEPLEDMLEDIENRKANNQYFELFALPHASVGISVSTNPAQPGDKAQGQDDPQAVNTLRDVFNAIAWIPGVGSRLYDTLLTAVMGNEAETIRTGKAHEVLPHVRVVRFREMEYTVPAELGPACLREIMATIRNKNLPLSFPIEYRYVKADDIWLSMFQGQDGATISIHQYGDLDYRPIFAELEPIFWRYGGRPHWGKLHTLKASDLAALYPNHWRDFLAVRESLDPDKRLMNAHLKELFGA